MAQKKPFGITIDGKTIASMLADVAKRSSALKGDVHVLMCSIVAHAVKHGDVTFADKLIEALGDGWRLNACRAWFIEYGPMSWVAKTSDKAAHFALNKEKRAAMLPKLEDDEADYLETLVSTQTYWEYKPEAEFKPFNLKAEIARLVRTAEKYAKDDGRKAKGKDDFLGLNRLKKLAEDIKDDAKPNGSGNGSDDSDEAEINA